MKKSRLKLFPLALMLLAGGITSIITFYFDYEIKTVLLILLSVLLVFYIAGLGIEAIMESFEKSIAEREKERLRQEGMVLEKEAETGEAPEEEVSEEANTEE